MNYPQEKIKPYNADEKKSVQVEKMFDNIAPAYRFLYFIKKMPEV